MNIQCSVYRLNQIGILGIDELWLKNENKKPKDEESDNGHSTKELWLLESTECVLKGFEFSLTMKWMSVMNLGAIWGNRLRSYHFNYH